MVAPSFQSMEIVKKPYEKNGKMYVDVLNSKTRNIRSVRWYSEKEYAKAYGNKKTDVIDFSEGLKDVRGFAKDFIYLVAKKKSPFTAEDREYIFKVCGGTYAVDVGFFHRSDSEFKEYPSKETYKVLKLSWESFNKYFGKGDAQEGKSELSKFIQDTHPNLYFCFGAKSFYDFISKT